MTANKAKKMVNKVIEREFPIRDQAIYLNHAGVAPWPRRTGEALKAFCDDNCLYGPLHYEAWRRVEHGLRDQLRRLINAPSADDIALLKNTSEGLSVVAYGIDWQPGDNVVGSDQEFPSNRIVWESLAPMGVEFRPATLTDTETPEDAIFSQVDDRTRVISVSAVQYASGLRMDLERIGRFCRGRELLFCVDAIQGLGALQFDAQSVDADFVVADAHKWLLGPEGIALFYSRAETRDRLGLKQFGWHMVEHSGDFTRQDWEVAHSARRFECGSPNMLGIHGMSASLSLLLEIGLEAIERSVLTHSGHLLEGLAAIKNIELITDTAPERRSGIVTFRHQLKDVPTVLQTLAGRKIIAAARGGGIRLSPHFYHSSEDLDTVLRLLEALTG